MSLAVLVAAAPVMAAGQPPGVRVSISRTGVSANLGDGFHFTSTVTNTGRTAASGLVAHLDVVSLSQGVYVDPEDWSSQRTHYLAPLQPGQSRTIKWSVEAVNGGEFAIYAVIVDRRAATPPATSPALRAHITERRTLNSDGVLPLAIGVPGLLGAAALAVRRRRRD